VNFTQIKETCLYFEDLEKAHDFYYGLLELPVISYVKDKHIFFRAGSSVLLCFNPEDSKVKKSPPPHYALGKPHFALEVNAENYEETKAAFQKRGIKISDTVIWSGGQESFYFEDPAGNIGEVVPVGIWN
jgi:catechol 2,3-dioxygenase-like lactoylglutathione lyase family enzyme